MKTLSTQITFKNKEKFRDMWQYLAAADKKIVMYGMGNGADKILSVCADYSIEISDFFASDGFVRGHSFHGKRVLSYSEIKEKYGAENIIVLLSFASNLPDVLENIYRIAEECELYAPDVPVYGDSIFTWDFFEKNQDKFEQVYASLADDESRRIYAEIIRYKLSGDISHLRNAESDKREAFCDILNAQSITSYADLGAYNGDTIRELLPYAPALKKIYAMEPDARNFRKLGEYYAALASPSFELCAHNVGAWDREDTLFFDKSGNRNANITKNASNFSEAINERGKKTVEVKVSSLDNILGGAPVDYIKYDVEGSEKEALLGSKETIAKHSPRLLVSLYHKSEDMFELPLLVKQLNPNYRLYLRRTRYVPAWDINLYAI